jgi:hypothetical protein
MSSLAREHSHIEIRQPLGERLGVNLVAPRCLMAWRNIDGWLVVPQFDVVVRFNVHLSAPVAHILDTNNLGGDAVIETVADGDVVSGHGAA